MITFIEKILGEKMKKSTKELTVRTKHWLTKARKKKLYVVLYILRMVGYV